MFCKKVGGVLQGWNKQELADFCRIKDNDAGRQIVCTMLSKCINEPFAWPSMLGDPSLLLRGFWKGRHIAAVDLRLAPLRMIHMSSGKATLGVVLIPNVAAAPPPNADLLGGHHPHKKRVLAHTRTSSYSYYYYYYDCNLP